MKKFLLLFMVVCGLIYAQPQFIPYQGKLTDSEDIVVAGTVDLTFKIYNNIPTELWTETHSNVAVNSGLFQVDLGSVQSFPGDLFGSDDLWLGIAINSDPEMIPRIELGSVPFALRAETASPDDDWQYSGNNIYNTENNIGIGTSSPLAKLHVNSNSTYAGYFRTAGSSVNYGIYGLAEDGTRNYGVYGEVQNSYENNEENYAGYFKSSGITQNYSYGVKSEVEGGTRNYGFYGTALESEENIGGYFRANGDNEASGSSWGVYGSASGNLANFGSYNVASGGETAYGLYATANYGDRNWAGFFSAGNVGIKHRLGVGVQNDTDILNRIYAESDEAGATAATTYFKNTGTGIAQILETTNQENDDTTLLIVQRGNESNSDFIRLDAYPPAGWNRRFRFTSSGDGRCDGSWIGGGADYAEYFPKAEPLETFEPGDVVLLSTKGFSVEKGEEPYSKRIAGVYSTNPVVVGNSTAEKDPENQVLVGMMGVVPTKVITDNGTIEVGDFITAAGTKGCAMKANKPGMVIGRALEPYNGKGVGKIKVYVNIMWSGYSKGE